MFNQERRKDARAKGSIRFWYRMPWSRVWHASRTMDISVGGMSFQLPQGLCIKGLPVEVAVELPSAAFRSGTRVVNVRKGENGREVGLRFKDLPTALRDRLKTCLDRMRLVDVTSKNPTFSI